jgi:hypothetical protein
MARHPNFALRKDPISKPLGTNVGSRTGRYTYEDNAHVKVKSHPHSRNATQGICLSLTHNN